MSKKDPALDPSTPSTFYEVMRPRWDLIEAVLGGTETMRSAGTLYLPQHPEEDDDTYDERLDTASLLNLTKLTLDSWVGRPFSDPVNVSEEGSAEIKALFENIDLQGNNLDVFARQWFREGVAKGFSHVLVDFPRLATEPGRTRTRADDLAEGVRPYWVHVKPESLIAARATILEGREVLTHARIAFSEVVANGYAETETPKIRELNLVEIDGVRKVEVKIWAFERRNKRRKEEWVLKETYDMDIPLIPLITFYAERDGFMTCTPPMKDLADLNVTHWQSGSDQRSILTVARFPMLACSGGNDEEDGQNLRVGPRQWLFTDDPQGKFYYVEHTGQAIGAGRQDLVDLETQMSNYGAEFLKKRPGRETATARALDSAEATSPLQDMALRFNDALEQATVVTARWLGQRPEDIPALAVSTEFGPEDALVQDLQTLTTMRAGRDISRLTLLQEAKRRGLLGDDFDVDLNEQQLEDELSDIPESNIDEGAEG